MTGRPAKNLAGQCREHLERSAPLPDRNAIVHLVTPAVLSLLVRVGIRLARVTPTLSFRANRGHESPGLLRPNAKAPSEVLCRDVPLVRLPMARIFHPGKLQELRIYPR